jgi:RHS repeat-associated protein
LVYDAENRLSSVTVGGQITQFFYDADGQRVRTLYPNGTNVYTPFPEYEETVSGSTVTKRSNYYLNGQLFAFRVVTGSTAAHYFTFADHLRSVSAISYSGGTFYNGSYAKYKPFGAYHTEPTTNPSLTDRGFTGHRHNNTGSYDLGLIYMNARYYMPEIGRFISPDTIVPDPQNPPSYNRYSYTLNSPTNLTDPSGHRECGGPYDPECRRPPLPPNSEAFKSAEYGYFDADHIRNEIRRIRYVVQQIESGEPIRLPYSFADGFGFAVYYTASGTLSSNQVPHVALAIIMDYETRVENAQQAGGVISRRTRATAYSIEDLPSDYLGAYLGLYGEPGEPLDLMIARTFASLGGAQPVAEVPHPNRTLWGTTQGLPIPISVPVTNREFTPLVLNEGEWQNVPWPDELQIAPMDTSGLWQYVKTGYCIFGFRDCN